MFVLLEDIKRMLKNQHLSTECLDARLAHVEGHLHCDPNIVSPSGSSARDPSIISSSNT